MNRPAAHGGVALPSFDALLECALAEWPATVDLPIRDITDFKPPATIVEGLTDLNDRLCRAWIEDPDEVFMATMHWRIATVLHAAMAARRAPVDVRDLDVQAIRQIFENDLRRIVRRRFSWTSRDIARARAYFRANRSA